MKISLPVISAILTGILNCAVWYLLALKMSFYSDTYYGYRLIIMFGFVLLGVFITTLISKRKNGGFIEFREVLRSGMLFSLILATILSLFNYVYHTFITPDTIDYFVSQAQKDGIEHKLSPDKLKQYVDFQKSTFSSFRLLPPTLFGGLIVSLLTGAILQKSRPRIPANES